MYTLSQYLDQESNFVYDYCAIKSYTRLVQASIHFASQTNDMLKFAVRHARTKNVFEVSVTSVG